MPSPEEIIANRDISLMNSLPLCGLSVRPLSLRSFILLKQCRNRFIVGGESPGPADVAVFLWMVAHEYTPDPKARARFMKSIRYLTRSPRWTQCALEIFAFLGAAFQDSPGREVSARSLIDLLASNYGWRDEDILEMPIARAFLYRMTILQRLGEKP